MSSFSFLFFFPKILIAQIAATEGACARCSSRKLDVRLMRTAMPLATMHFEGCVWCDEG